MATQNRLAQVIKFAADFPDGTKVEMYSPSSFARDVLIDDIYAVFSSTDDLVVELMINESPANLFAVKSAESGRRISLLEQLTIKQSIQWAAPNKIHMRFLNGTPPGFVYAHVIAYTVEDDGNV